MFFPSRKSDTPPPEPSGTSLLTVLCAVGVGAALMFLFDPASGRRRRALIKDKSNHYAPRMNQAEAADDDVLAERVRAALGRVVSDAHAIDVKVRDGCVILKGPVTPEEVGEIVACTRRVRGVQRVENRLSPHTPQGGPQ